MKHEEIQRPLKLSTKEQFTEIEAPYLEARQTEDDALIDLLISPFLLTGENADASQITGFDEETAHHCYQAFNQMTYSVGKMVRLAELNRDHLGRFIHRYFQQHDPCEVADRNADCRKLNPNKMKEGTLQLTFANLRNILSCIVKTDERFHDLAGLQMPEHRSNFTKVYQNYITDRDRYTHGILFFKYPSLEPLLRVRSGKKLRYITLNENIFLDNLRTFQYLTNLVKEMKELLKNSE